MTQIGEPVREGEIVPQEVPVPVREPAEKPVEVEVEEPDLVPA